MNPAADPFKLKRLDRSSHADENLTLRDRRKVPHPIVDAWGADEK
jgi:hypothetical protein